MSGDPQDKGRVCSEDLPAGFHSLGSRIGLLLGYDLASHSLFPGLPLGGWPRVPERALDWEPDLGSGLSSAVPSHETEPSPSPLKITRALACLTGVM